MNVAGGTEEELDSWKLFFNKDAKFCQSLKNTQWQTQDFNFILSLFCDNLPSLFLVNGNET